MSLPRGIAQTVTFPLLDLNQSPLTGKTVTAHVIKDGGTPATSVNAVHEVGSGQYSLALTASERDADEIVVLATDGVVSTRAAFYPGVADLSPVQSVVDDIKRWFTNKRVVSPTSQTLYADDGETVLSEQALSTDGTSFTRGAAE